MDRIGTGDDHAAMKKAPQKRAAREYTRNYVAEWLDRLGVKPVELVKAEIISEGYLSLIRNGKRLGISPGKLKQIGDFLKIQWTDLYRPPPSQETMAELEGVGAETLARMRVTGRH